MISLLRSPLRAVLGLFLVVGALTLALTGIVPAWDAFVIVLRATLVFAVFMGGMWFLLGVER